MLPAAVRSLNYATTPVECCSDVWTNFLHCMTFELLECVPVFRLDPVCTCVCVRAHVCMFVCMFHYVIVCVFCAFVLICLLAWSTSKCACVQYMHMLSVCDYVGVIARVGPFSLHIYKCICVSPWVHVRACVCDRDGTRGLFKMCVCESVCACQGVWNMGLCHLALCPTPYGSHHPL